MMTFLLATHLATALSGAPVAIAVDADAGRTPVSPWIYGRNSSLKAAEVDQDTAAGIRLVRANGGNNATKYNWRKKLSSHPDWYNNVYANDWDAAAKTIQTKYPGGQGLFAFQLLGWAADNTSNNFNDWAYNQSAWWAGTGQNLAGSGEPDPAGAGKAKTEGDPAKYLTPWPPDSTAGILDHWFGAGGLGYDSTRLRYWNMDNEPDGWSGTHDDVVPALTGHLVTAEEFVQKWVAVAKAVRKKFPGVRLVGPASMTEWQWYTWNDKSVSYKGKSLCFPEFLIQRLAEIQDSTGERMLDVYDIHLYFNVPANATLAQNLQTHRLLYDTAFANPWANGIKTVNGGWDETIRKEYVFGRIRGWLDKHFGPGNGIGIGSTESGVGDAAMNDASAAAVWHASMLGTMADHGTELYTPWFWAPGMYEATHLFARHAFPTRVASRSALDSIVSAYASLSNGGDSLCAILVNRDPTGAREVALDIQGFVSQGPARFLRLAGLSGETFRSRTDNALVAGEAPVAESTVNLTLPALSVTALKLAGKAAPVRIAPPPVRAAAGRLVQSGQNLVLTETGNVLLELLDADGHAVRVSSPKDPPTVSLAGLARGVYLARWPGGSKRVFVLR